MCTFHFAADISVTSAFLVGHWWNMLLKSTNNCNPFVNYWKKLSEIVYIILSENFNNSVRINVKNNILISLNSLDVSWSIHDEDFRDISNA